MLLSLSPGLQQTIAKEEIGRFICSIPFFRYAICRTLDIKRGASCHVEPRERSGGPIRPGTVLRPGWDAMSFDVAYADVGDDEPDAIERDAGVRTDAAFLWGPRARLSSA